MSNNEITGEPNPETFDITEWLTPEGEKNHRRTEEVNLIRDLNMDPKVYELRRLQNEAKREQEKGGADKSVADSTVSTELAERLEKVKAELEAVTTTVTVRAMLLPEIMDAVKRIPEKDENYWPSILAECVLWPGNKRLSKDQWKQVRNTIGEGQFTKLVEAFQRVTYTAPVVTSSF